MMDGMPIVGLADHITKTSYEAAQNKTYSDFPSDIYSEIEDIFEDVHLSTSVHECIGKGSCNVFVLCVLHPLCVLYGSAWVIFLKSNRTYFSYDPN